MHVLYRLFHALTSNERGQTTAEYALVILGAAVVAGGLAIWAKGGAIKDLFDSVIGKIL